MRSNEPDYEVVDLNASGLTTTEIEALVLGAMSNTNQAQIPAKQLRVAADAPLFGADSPLDSLGLVSLLIDIEEALAERGFEVNLSDARAMSESRSPFRNVPALVGYIRERLDAAP